MDNGFDKDSMLGFYIFETQEQVEQLENIALNIENLNNIDDQINEIFRLVHTIKGSSAVMNYDSIVSLTHSLEDAFYYIREKHPASLNYSQLTDIILKSTDFIKNQIKIIQSGEYQENDNSVIIKDIHNFLKLAGYEGIPAKNSNEVSAKDNLQMDTSVLLPNYRALIFFEEGCEMENVRAYNILHTIEKNTDIIGYSPRDILENPETAAVIRKCGFKLELYSELSFDDMKYLLSSTLFTKNVQLEVIETNDCADKTGNKEKQNKKVKNDTDNTTFRQSMISVNVSKLDRLMDLVGELVISQDMVIQNSELEGLELNGFHKASRQLIKVTNEIQDAVMSIRMISLAITFQKMQRIIRDMSKKQGKEVNLTVIGENTEVDKNIIEHLSDPLIHLVRNAVDHGIELPEERIRAGKERTGTVKLEARNEGGDVWIIVSDDGKGLDREKILNKAREQGLITVLTEREYIDREIYSFIFLPGFSTCDEVTEYSGRGVGMDVVNKNIGEIGGTILIDSMVGKGTTISIKIPLTLAIIDGMKVRVGKSIYIIPITSIRESFRIQDASVMSSGTKESDMILLRGKCYPLINLHDIFKIPLGGDGLSNGIIVVVQNESKTVCLYVDDLLGEQQIVVKALPECIKKVKWLSGCTVMGDGSVRLIIDISGIINGV